MRNESEKTKTYQFSASRWIREEASFTVEAEDSATAELLAQTIIDNDECEWFPDFECEVSDVGYDFEEAEPSGGKRLMPKEAKST